MRKKRYFFIVLFFIMASVVFTYPLFFKINNVISGTQTTDEPYAALWSFWWFKYAFTHHLADSFYSIIAVPFGFDTGGHSIYPAWEFLYKWLAVFTNNIFAFNIQIFLSFVLAGITMYLLVFYLTKNNISALFAGLIYAFCPYHFARAWQHLGLAQIQWMPLYILSLLRLKGRVTYRNAFFCLLCFYLVISFEFHYAYFMYIVTILFALYSGLCHRGKIEPYIRLLKFIFLIMFVSIFFILPTSASIGIKQIFFERKNTAPSAWSAVRPFEDLFLQSARPLSYLLPVTEHPVFGKFTEQFMGSSLYGVSFTEHALYLGWVPLFLAFIALQRYREGRRGHRIGTEASADFYQGFFIFLAITAWLFSQPPWWNIFGFKLYMPSFFLYKIAPIIRAYCRMGVVVMLAVSVLAGFGLKFVLERFTSRRMKFGVTILIFSMVCFEFWNYPPFKLIDLSGVPAAYRWLKDQPGDITIAEYPIDTESPNELYKFYQSIHEKKIINGSLPGTYANKIAKTIIKLSDFDTAAVLRGLGAKYVLVHKEGYLSTGLLHDTQELEKIAHNRGLKLIGNFSGQDCPKDIMCTQKTGPVDVYEIIAQPLNPTVE